MGCLNALEITAIFAKQWLCGQVLPSVADSDNTSKACACSDTQKSCLLLPGSRSLPPPLSFASHMIFNGSPETFDCLPVSPSPSLSCLSIYVGTVCLLIPAFKEERFNARTPTLDLVGGVLTPLSNVDTENVPEQLLCFTPFVASKLPHLACRKDRHNAVPVVWLKLLGTFDDDEPVWPSTLIK
jgi:hypothetical protein